MIILGIGGGIRGKLRVHLAKSRIFDLSYYWNQAEQYFDLFIFRNKHSEADINFKFTLFKSKCTISFVFVKCLRHSCPRWSHSRNFPWLSKHLQHMVTLWLGRHKYVQYFCTFLVTVVFDLCYL